MAAADTGCFYGDGTAAVDWAFAPCQQRNTTFRICCLPGMGDACLANGLCAYPGHYMYRGPCDNRRGAGCRSICPEINPNSWTEVQMCTPTEYCCSPERNAGTPGNCCNDRSKRFPLPDPISASETSSASAATSPSSTPNPSAQQTRAVEGGGNGGGGGGGGGGSTAAIVGGVLGGVIGLALVGVGVWLVLARRRRRYPVTSPAHGRGTDKAVGPATEVEARSAPVESDSRPLQQRWFEMSG